MFKSLAVAIIHGMGNQIPGFAEEMITLIHKRFVKQLKHLVDDPSPYLIIQPIHWGGVLSEREEKLFQKTVLDNHLDYQQLRKFIIHYLGDSIAYQPVETVNHNYERVHEEIGKNLNVLSKRSGDHTPLCVISHSLGSVIASNYFYDLQFKQNDVTSVVSESSPLEKGETLTLFYTLGTALPLWSLRYHNFDRPINIPSTKLRDFYPGLEGEWINFYDKDDILGYPLRDVSENYKNSVTEDREVNIGNLLTSWNPLCHSSYFIDMDVINPIVDGLVRTWRHINDV
ncbi:chemotaxis protein [Priestia endophytica]|uniref:chemotaxis protein n=1 Tax=Priestia endophytica TaxID=135735 RepID=UPI002280B958|nr:chemotaxis protein [Priestia endophytica]MCY8235271.1 chemotaxis protein [Priestia endophytica]